MKQSHAKYFADAGIPKLYDKVMEQERLSLEDGELLFEHPDFHAVTALAHLARARRHGDAVHYVRNRHVNYTNVCVQRCRFCAFCRREDEEGAFTLDLDDVLRRLDAPEARGIDEVHIVGGCHPSLGLEYFEDLLRGVGREHPNLVIKGFTVVEIAHFAGLEGIDVREVLARLKDAGLKMLPGGGAEVFDPALRERLCPKKISGERWLEISGLAHGMGLKTNCTMLFGHVESHRQRLEHLDALRRQQDRSGGFVCFIPLPYLYGGNPLGKELNAPPAGARGLDELRTIAISRLMLDNIPHIKAYWVMLGFKQALMALHCGADDLDGTILEEHIGHMAGADSEQAMTETELTSAILASGFTPQRRDGLFRRI